MSEGLQSGTELVLQAEHGNALDFRKATDAAQLCKQIVVATAITIASRKYVRVEGWQAIAIAHGCVASSGEVERIPEGIRAIGTIRRGSDGMIVAQAEGFVGDDEETWGKRQEYAKRAMAQTRAISRACRSAFAHVVVMMQAGLQTTPAEEVPQEGFEKDDLAKAPPPLTKPHLTTIKALIADSKTDEGRLLEYVGAATIESIPDSRFAEIEHLLLTKRRQA